MRSTALWWNNHWAFVCHMYLPFVASGGKRGCEGDSLPVLPICVHFFLQYTFMSFMLLILAFYLSLLCCVVLYKWLEADLHGKSSDTANKASGKQGWRTKRSTGPPYFFTFRPPPLNQIKDQSLKTKMLAFFILLPNLNQHLVNFILFLEALLADVLLLSQEMPLVVWGTHTIHNPLCLPA